MYSERQYDTVAPNQVSPFLQQGQELCRRAEHSLASGDATEARNAILTLESLCGTHEEKDPLTAVRVAEQLLKDLSGLQGALQSHTEHSGLSRRVDTLRSQLEQRRKERMLEAAGPGYQQGWNDLTRVAPELLDIPLAFHNHPTASYSVGRDGSPERINLPHPDVQDFEALKRDHPDSIAAIAKRLRKQLNELSESEFQRFVLLHESGHAQDRRINFPSGTEGQERFRTQSHREMNSLPFGPYSPQKLAAWLRSAPWELFQKEDPRFASRVREEVIAEQARAYRRLPKERFADTFAMEALKRIEDDPLS